MLGGPPTTFAERAVFGSDAGSEIRTAPGTNFSNGPDISQWMQPENHGI